MASRQPSNRATPPRAITQDALPILDEQSAIQEKRHESPSDRLRRLGVRVTPQRLFVLEALELNSGHMTAEEIMQWASRRYPALNLATVYRTLDLLIEVGLVAQTDLGGGAAPTSWSATLPTTTWRASAAAPSSRWMRRCSKGCAPRRCASTASTPARATWRSTASAAPAGRRSRAA